METLIVEGDIGDAFYHIEEGHFNISIEIEQRQKQSTARKDTSNTIMSDTNNTNTNRKDTLQSAK